MEKKLKIGDRVCFSRVFLRNTGQFVGWQPFAEGTITKAQPLGSRDLLTVTWDRARAHRLSGELGPAKSNVLDVNLILVNRKHLERA